MAMVEKQRVPGGLVDDQHHKSSKEETGHDASDDSSASEGEIEESPPVKKFPVDSDKPEKMNPSRGPNPDQGSNRGSKRPLVAASGGNNRAEGKPSGGAVKPTDAGGARFLPGALRAAR